MNYFRAFLPRILTLFVFLVVLGCDGETGLTGPKGSKGSKGDDSIDPESTAPTSRYLSVGIVNGSLRAVAATEPVWVTFDTSGLARGDTVVGNRLERPPLLDGIDGGEEEWGPRKSRVRMRPVRLQPEVDSIPDSHIYNLRLRLAYDDCYIYLQLFWNEVTVITDHDGGTAAPIVSAGKSTEENDLYLDIGHPDTVCHIVNGQTQVDTVFSYLRRQKRIVLDSVCFPPPPLPPIICEITARTCYDTSYVWKTLASLEDKAAVYWCLDDSPALSELPARAFAAATVSCADMVGDSQVDIWRWGAATSEPVAIADDWSLLHGIIAPDNGESPYIGNWQLPDSTPRYVHRFDPIQIYTYESYLKMHIPLWAFEAISYSAHGWSTDFSVYVPGIVMTLPSRSRADVAACGRYDGGGQEWTLELKRARRTGNGDDIQF